MENQRDHLHIVTDYYPEGNLVDFAIRKIYLKEWELK